MGVCLWSFSLLRIFLLVLSEIWMLFSYLSFKKYPIFSKEDIVFQQVFTAQEPETPWQRQSTDINLATACRPASLLCRFMASRTLLSFSVVFLTGKSRNFLLNHMPYWTSSEHPPQCQPSLAEPPFCKVVSQEHSVMLPALHDLVTECTRPAAMMA